MRKTRILTAFILTFALVLSAVPAFADTANVSINEMNIQVNEVAVAVTGESYALEDGSEVPYSLLYKGTTYLPMRKVGELVGKDIAYDHETKTASIISTTAAAVAPTPCTHTAIAGTKENITFATNSLNVVVDEKTVAKVGDSYTLLDGNSVPFSLVYNGTTYLPMRKIGELVGKDVGYDNTTKTADIRDKVAAYEESTLVPDLGLIADIKAIDTAIEDGKTTYTYDAKLLNEIDSDIFENNLLNNGFVNKGDVKVPELGEGANMIVYFNEVAKTSVAVGAMYDQEPTDPKNPMLLVFVQINPNEAAK